MSKIKKSKKVKIIEQLLNYESQILYGILTRVRNIVEYSHLKTPEEILESLEQIANPDKWDYIGLLNKEERAVRDNLRYLSNDEQVEIRKETWRKTER